MMTPLDRAANALRELWLAANSIPATLRWEQLQPSEQQHWVDRAETAISPRRPA